MNKACFLTLPTLGLLCICIPAADKPDAPATPAAPNWAEHPENNWVRQSPTPQAPAAELKWDANPEKGIAGYRVYKLEGTWNIVQLTAEPIRATTFTHKSGGPTRYWIVAVDALGQEGQPSSPVWHQHRYEGFFKGEWHQ